MIRTKEGWLFHNTLKMMTNFGSDLGKYLDFEARSDEVGPLAIENLKRKHAPEIV